MTSPRVSAHSTSSSSESRTPPARQQTPEPTHLEGGNGWLSESEDEKEKSSTPPVAASTPDAPMSISSGDCVVPTRPDTGKRPVVSDDEEEPVRGKRLRMELGMIEAGRARVVARRVEDLVRGWSSIEEVPSTFEIGESSSAVVGEQVFGGSMGRILAALSLRFYRQDCRLQELLGETYKMRRTVDLWEGHISALEAEHVLAESALDQMHHRLGVDESRLRDMRDRLNAAELATVHAHAAAASAEQRVEALTQSLEETKALVATQGMLISMLLFGVPPP